MDPKKIILIDGNSLIYRAFFALPQTLASSSGQITNAAYGFTTMLIKLLQTEEPELMAVAFDKAAPTFRHEEYEEYKAHRPRMPDELRSQFPIVKEILGAFNIPIYELEGYEADDLLAALSKKAEEQGYEVLVVTGDRDALQLISPHIKVVATRTGITDIIVYDRQKVLERYGVPPEKIPDLLGLKGDTSDNIPGIPGIGDKTAAKLVNEYGNVENALANASRVTSKKIREALLAHTEQAKISKKLATLATEVPLEINLEDCRLGEWNAEEIKQLFSSLEFQSLLNRLFPEGEVSTAKPLKYKMVMVDTEAKEKEVLNKLAKAKELAVALNCSGVPVDCNLYGIALAVDSKKAYYIPVTILSGDFWEKVISFLQSDILHKFIYDAKSLYVYLYNNGVCVRAITFDPLIAAYLLDPTKGDYPLEDIVREFLGLELPEVEGEELVSQRAVASLALKDRLQKAMEEKGITELFADLEMPLLNVLAKMEIEGVGIDTEHLNEFGKGVEKNILRLTKEIFSLTGHEFNLNSPQQLSTVLFKELELKPRKRTKTGLGTGAEVLQEMVDEHPIIEKILQYRELSKLKSTYIFALPKLVNRKTGRLHTSFNQAVTATGRLSSSNPNLQNIPVRTDLGREIRKAFVPARSTDKLLIADYSQIELRLVAHFSGDENLSKAFEQDQDIHRATAAEIFGVDSEEVTEEMRRQAKAVNFGIVYGISAFGLGKNLGISDEEAQLYITNYFAKYPRVQEFINQRISEAYRLGYVITILNRRRDLPELTSSNLRVRQFGERLAVNTPLQGSAADIIKLAMVRLDKELTERNMKTKMVLQVHDELVFEVPKEEEEEAIKLVREVMENIYPLKVKLKVDIKLGSNWNEAK